MDNKFFSNNPEIVKKQIESIKNIVEGQMYHSQAINNYKLQIIPNETIKPALFQPIKDKPNYYMAHPLTIEALKKDIFALDEEMLELQNLYTCEKCKHEIDVQFWHFCPHCGTQFYLEESK